MTTKKAVPTVVDLYAGVGGLSLGAARAGLKVQAAFELDQLAHDTHKLNFPNSRHIRTDVGNYTGRKLLEDSGLKTGELGGLIGGPPCQGFSEIGHRATSDPRNQLFVHFFRLVSEAEPAFFLAENVPGLLADRNVELVERAKAHLPKRYKMLEPIRVKASDYAAPTSRTRVFFYGFDPDRIGTLTKDDFEPPTRRDIRVKDALIHMPKLHSSWQSAEQGWRAVGALGRSKFHQQIMDSIPDGVGNAEAIQKYKKKRLASGFLGTRHENATIARFAALAPGTRDAVSKCPRLDREGYCPTLLAGTGPERGSYQAIRPIHPTSPRVIAPREAARLQGFPDWFQFHQTKWHAFRQLGNSVSPIVAEVLLKRILTAMT
jgi:DNA (cytosine-5)-methyltransferase 1